MKLVEAIIGISLISLVLGLGLNFFAISNKNIANFENDLKKSSTKSNLYNYSNILVKNNPNNSGYIFFSGDNFQISNTKPASSTGYFFECMSNTGHLIKINKKFSGNFCKIEFKNKYIYNYNL